MVTSPNTEGLCFCCFAEVIGRIIVTTKQTWWGPKKFTSSILRCYTWWIHVDPKVPSWSQWTSQSSQSCFSSPCLSSWSSLKSSSPDLGRFAFRDPLPIGPIGNSSELRTVLVRDMAPYPMQGLELRSSKPSNDSENWYVHSLWPGFNLKRLNNQPKKVELAWKNLLGNFDATLQSADMANLAMSRSFTRLSIGILCVNVCTLYIYLM